MDNENRNDAHEAVGKVQDALRSSFGPLMRAGADDRIINDMMEIGMGLAGVHRQIEVGKTVVEIDGLLDSLKCRDGGKGVPLTAAVINDVVSNVKMLVERIRVM